ncbi:DUF1616 domain-containing protein [Caldivirga sp. UBA161]|uniref:DUF1616 domain-containing protein n=1 Tax=Caldivirga sp. UBA161 TaxID=1915569 RepID=UPI0025C4C4F3|nr:DUF1616 domain-containing protein [Caldivirga sp. UBA161]
MRIRALMVLMLLTVVAFMPLVGAQVEELLYAYGNVTRLSVEGANVTVLVNELNNAINLTQRGEVKGAVAIVNSIMSQVPSLEANARLHTLVVSVEYGSLVIALIAIIALIYVKRRELIGSIWLRFRGSSVVKVGSGRARTLIYNEEAAAIVLALIIILAVFITAQSVVSREAEAFSAIGLLGPGGRIGGYPSVVYVNTSLSLYVFVYNHMNKPIWYVVKVYLLNASNTAQPPLNATPLLTYERILLNNQSWVAPLNLTINNTGSYRLLAELWLYNPVNLTLTYTGEYVQLWFNATGVG